MCGIMGCIGQADCVSTVLKGLSFLEYRGYDSSGLAVITDNSIKISKKKGRVSALKASIKSDCIGTTCIGHTRWATHGAPSDNNSHPFLSNDCSFALVHNGVIENYLPLKKFLIEQGYSFSSETDSEIIVNLIQYFFNGDILNAISDTVKRLKGSFAIALITAHEKEKIYFVKKDNPLIIGLKNSVGYLCSDIPGLFPYIDECIVPDDYSIGVISSNSIRLYDFDIHPLEITFTPLIKEENLSLSGYSHFMRKEIDEIPDALSRAINSYYLNFSPSFLPNFSRIVFIGCGTALHAGIASKRLLRTLLPQLDCYAEPASEFLFEEFPYSDTLFIAISQSGETADTLNAVKKIKSRKGKVLAVCNVSASSIVRESDYLINTSAGTEIAVASTKAYNCQLAVLFALCLDIVSLKKQTPMLKDISCELMSIPSFAQKVLDCEKTVSDIAYKNINTSCVFYLGRGLDYCVANEGSLKLKEISYIHSESYASGELKHGTLALIEKGVLVIAIVTQSNTLNKMATCLTEVKSRGAHIMLITPFNDENLLKISDYTVKIPNINELFSPIISVIPTQLFAYYSALYRGLDIDKPRNLAKSVTVE